MKNPAYSPFSVLQPYQLPMMETESRFVTYFADTKEAQKISFRLRYETFCDETGFEDSAKFPDKLEKDRYDKSSAHFLIWDRLTREWAGTMRLVDARRTDLPSESICAPEKLLNLDSNREKSIEFSRLCIRRRFRHVHRTTFFRYSPSAGNPDSGTPSMSILKQEHNEILLRALLAFLAWAHEEGIEHAYFLINAALARILKRLHMPLTVAGVKVEHRGKRTPYTTHVDTAYRVMRQALPELKSIEDMGASYVSYRTSGPLAETRPLYSDETMRALGKRAEIHSIVQQREA